MATLIIRREACRSLNPLLVAVEFDVTLSLALKIATKFVMTDAYALCLSHDGGKFVGSIHSTEWLMKKINEAEL
jgi:hypothetical protein